MGTLALLLALTLIFLMIAVFTYLASMGTPMGGGRQSPAERVIMVLSAWAFAFLFGITLLYAIGFGLYSLFT